MFVLGGFSDSDVVVCMKCVCAGLSVWLCVFALIVRFVRFSWCSWGWCGLRAKCLFCLGFLYLGVWVVWVTCLLGCCIC